MGKSFLREYLSNKLSLKEQREIYTSFDIIGDIAIIKIPSSLDSKRNLIAEAVLAANKKVKTVLQQVTPVSGEFRLRQLNWICGEKKTETVYREYGCIFKIDLSEAYFSSRLSYERMRITKMAQPHETVINMFAGIGCFSISLAKHSKVKKIFSIDINPKAVELMRENVRLNKVEEKVEVILGDSIEIIEREMRSSADRILMPLPKKAYNYLDTALLALKSDVGFIHYYDFIHAKKEEKPIEKINRRIEEKMNELGIRFEVYSTRIVRTVGPNWYQIAVDLKVDQ